MAGSALRHHAAELMLCFSQDEQWRVPCLCAASSWNLSSKSAEMGEIWLFQGAC